MGRSHYHLTVENIKRLIKKGKNTAKKKNARGEHQKTRSFGGEKLASDGKERKRGLSFVDGEGESRLSRISKGQRTGHRAEGKGLQWGGQQERCGWNRREREKRKLPKLRGVKFVRKHVERWGCLLSKSRIKFGKSQGKTQSQGARGTIKVLDTAVPFCSVMIKMEEF